MSRPTSDTRQRIQDVARELFAEKGVQRTSLQDIANRLGITKPALYYHFSSREDLVRSILTPLIEDGERFIAVQEKRTGADRAGPRELLEGYFDFHFRHRADLVLAVTELTTLADLGLVDKLLAWRDRLVELRVWAPPEPEPVHSRRHRIRRPAGLLSTVPRHALQGFTRRSGGGSARGAGTHDVMPCAPRQSPADALVQLPADHGAVVRRACYHGRTTARIDQKWPASAGLLSTATSGGPHRTNYYRRTGQQRLWIRRPSQGALQEHVSGVSGNDLYCGDLVDRH